MNKIYKLAALLSVCLMAFAGCTNEELSTDQFVDEGVSFLGMGPNPVLRGGELRFMGSNLEKITEVRIPGVEPITEITQSDSLKGRVSEIRVIVPKDGPEVGKVVLVDAEGNEYASKTELSYLEPITISELSPAAVAPGDVLTIKGDYLNFMQEVIFSENVRVSVKDFKKHTRYEIQVVVPVEARTGLVALGDVDELNEEDKTLVPNIVYSESELTIAQPEVTKMEAPRYKVGETVTITGKNFQYVASVKLPGKDVTDFKVNDAKTVITFALPAEAQDGEAYLVAKSKVEVLAGEYETVVPTGLAVEPEPVKAGAVMTVSGKDLDIVTVVTLPNSGDAEFELKDGAITFTVPAEAQEGDAVFKMANGKEVKAAYTLVKPVVTAYSANPAAAGSPITFTGTDLDLVVSVTFGGELTVEVTEPAATEFTVSVPTTAENGKLLFNLANGKSVEGEELKVNKPEACYITELPGEDQEINGGQVLILPVANGEKLTGVQVNGEDVNFLLNEDALYITIPRLAKEGSKLVLVSSNGQVEYTIDCIPATITTTVLWTGEANIGHWGGMQDLAWGNYDWSSIDLSIGTQSLVFDVTLNDWGESWWQMELRHGTEWGQLPEAVHVDFTVGQTQVIVPLTQANLEDLIANNGLVVTGKEFTLTKISLKTEISLETTLWEGDMLVDDWKNDATFLLSDAGLELLEAGAKAGQKVHFYFEILESDWKVQIIEGHWGPTYASYCTVGADTESGKFSEYDLVANDGKISITLTEEILAAAYTQGYWGGTFLLNGDNLKCTKVTLE